MQKPPIFAIGIDAGVNTGVGVVENGVLKSVSSMTITQALFYVLSVKHKAPVLYIEDARKRKYFKKMDEQEEKYGSGAREGVGSVKRDCQIWEQFCIEHGLEYKLVSPAANTTKTTAKFFKAVTGWQGRTNNHARDATMLVGHLIVKQRPQRPIVKGVDAGPL